MFLYVMESTINPSILSSSPYVSLILIELELTSQVMQHVIDWYRPGAIVLQMGADSLAGDKLGGFNLTLDGKLKGLKSCRPKLIHQVTPSVLGSSRVSVFLP
jgi:hypothetical protein